MIFWRAPSCVTKEIFFKEYLPNDWAINLTDILHITNWSKLAPNFPYITPGNFYKSFMIPISRTITSKNKSLSAIWFLGILHSITYKKNQSSMFASDRKINGLYTAQEAKREKKKRRRKTRNSEARQGGSWTDKWIMRFPEGNGILLL